MKKMILATSLVATSAAMAADFKWNIEGRMDYNGSTVKQEYATTTNNFEEKRNEFSSGALRFNITSTINESLSARFRYRLSTEQASASQNRDLSFQNVDFFYIDHKTPWFTTRLGKHKQDDNLGRENFWSSLDYVTTQYKFASAGAAGSNGYTTSNSAVYNEIKNDLDLYHVGASFIFNQISGGNLTLAFYNPSKSKTYSDLTSRTGPVYSNAKNTSLAMGVSFNGSYMDKLVQPSVSYLTVGIDPETGDDVAHNTNKATNTLMAVGVKSEVAGFVVEADWKQYKRENSAVSGTDNSDKTTSIWSNVAYSMDNLTPFVNYIHDKYDRTAANTLYLADYTRNAISVGLNIKPFKDANFRYHVAYTNDVKESAVGTGGTVTTLVPTKVTANQYVAGIRFDL